VGELFLEKLEFFVTVQGDEIIVKTLCFYAAYVKPADELRLILHHRTDTDDHELLNQGWHAAMNKARAGLDRLKRRHVRPVLRQMPATADGDQLLRRAAQGLHRMPQRVRR
jgi:hypothetical protein